DKANLTLIGSCNGFICSLNGETHVVNHSVCISNPLLGEYFKVKLPEWEKRIRHIHYGFCYSEASGQYKVLRLVNRKFRGRPDVSELEVYTLGVDERNRRNVGKAPKPVQGTLSDANVNGTIHWLDGENLPKRYGIAGSWTRDRISVTLPGIAGRHILIPIIIWKDGEILMQSERGTHLVSYNPKEEMLKKVVNVYVIGELFGAKCEGRGLFGDGLGETLGLERGYTISTLGIDCGDCGFPKAFLGNVGILDKEGEISNEVAHVKKNKVAKMEKL
ncbi:hypothetical protein MTR67_022021, partial [Solanum verrucosum]